MRPASRSCPRRARRPSPGSWRRRRCRTRASPPRARISAATASCGNAPVSDRGDTLLLCRRRRPGVARPDLAGTSGAVDRDWKPRAHRRTYLHPIRRQTGRTGNGQLGQVGHRHRRGTGHRACVRAAVRGRRRKGGHRRRPVGEGRGGGAVPARGGRRGHVRHLRRGRPRTGRGARRKDGRGVWRSRRDDQQRRGAPSRRHPRDRRRRLRPRRAGEPERVFPDRPGRGEADGRPGPRRRDHQHVVDPGVRHQREPCSPTRYARAG